MFCISKTSLVVVGLALSPSICRTAEEAEEERLSGAVDQLEVVIERSCGDRDLASCQDSVGIVRELQHAQDTSDD